MKTLLTLLVVVLVPVGVMATVDPDPNGIGVYFDLDGDVVCTTTSAPFANTVAYLLVTNPDASSGVSGWEAQIWTEGAAPAAPMWTLSAGLDVDPSPAGFQVGIGTISPLPYGITVLLATWSAFVMSPFDEISFFVTGVPGSVSFPGSPGYAVGDNAGDLRPLQVSSGTGLTAPVAMINSIECSVVANEDMTFSGVKALYR